MKRFAIVSTLWCASALALQAQPPHETGFLDRSITIDGMTSRYQVYVPADYTPDKTWPIIVDLHGNTLQGTDALLPTRRGMGDTIRQHRDAFPTLVVFPQARPGNYWEQLPMQQLVIGELNHTTEEFRIDPSRVYLTGFSMGAVGTYRIAYRWPDRFAALVAIAGRAQPVLVATAPERTEIDRQTNPFTIEKDPFAALAEHIKQIPIWIFHGDADETMAVEQSRQLVAALKNVGATVRYTEIPGASHNDSAARAYTDLDMVTWLLAQRRTSKPSQ